MLLREGEKMYKIRKVAFKNHKVLGNLVLDFCDANGKAVDTVILAGENGCGKSTILNELYRISCHQVNSPVALEVENDGEVYVLRYDWNKPNGGYMYVNDNQGLNVLYSSTKLKEKYPFTGIYSDVDINFKSENISNVTSLELDSFNESKRSSPSLPRDIKQLIIDIQALDYAEIAHFMRENPAKTYKDAQIKERMPRFTNAFNKMFATLSYSKVENRHGHKEILFIKNGVPIAIDDLSSGEKQIVFRGCFLLKDVNAMNGAFVFIDEPEISLHPSWQEKIMEYYKGIFTNADEEQTSQIFAVTHSPFIIHNENRKNDKVVVLTRDGSGTIVVKDKPEYYKCDTMEAIKDAFYLSDFSAEKSVVYLEGRTDEKYFNKAIEVFGYNLPFEFKWIGSLDEKGQEINTGKDALNKAIPFLISQNTACKNVCLYDCDANKPLKKQGTVISFSMPKFDNDKGIEIGIENALIFNDIDIEPYRKQRIEIDGYGIEKRIPDFQKMDCCDYVCSLENNRLQKIFANLKSVIEKLVALFKE